QKLALRQARGAFDDILHGALLRQFAIQARQRGRCGGAQKRKRQQEIESKSSRVTWIGGDHRAERAGPNLSGLLPESDFSGRGHWIARPVRCSSSISSRRSSAQKRM